MTTTIDVDGVWVRWQGLVLPAQSRWRKQLGPGRPVLDVTVDCTSGEPRVTQVSVTAAAGSEVRARDVAALRDLPPLRDICAEVLEQHGGTTSVIDPFQIRPALSTAPPEARNGPVVRRRVTKATQRQEALLRDVAEVYEAAGGSAAGSAATEEVRLLLERRGLGASVRSAQDRITSARRRGLIAEGSDFEPPPAYEHRPLSFDVGTGEWS
ncbi:MAG: hypothetical protein AB7I24_09090 [Candidatus Nanopelagicales bacterium]